jgi:hypothetical protein
MFGNDPAMGGFYGSIHIRTTETKLVRTALEGLASEAGAKFLMAPAINGWVSVFPSDAGQNIELAEKLAASIKQPILHCLVHDDDVFMYQLFDGGRRLDGYDSCPNYFGGECADRGGSLEGFDRILPDATRRASLRELLDSDRFTFEIERLHRFATLLGLANAVTSYEYLQNGERDGIQQWKQFIHIPDLSGEKAAAKAAKAQGQAELKQLLKEGRLIVDQLGSKSVSPLFPRSPHWCIDPIRNDVLLAWSGSPIGDPIPTPVERVDPRTGARTPTRLLIPDKVFSMAASPSGQSLAVGCASGTWKAQMWDIESGRLVLEIPHERAVVEVGFGIDGKTLITLSEKFVTIVTLAAENRVDRIEHPEHPKAMALHPSGSHVALECAGLVAIVHLETRSVVTTVWIPEPPGPKRDLLEQFVPQAAEEMMKNIAARISVEEMEKYRAKCARHFLPKQSVHSLSFGSSGNYLFCGTTAGACALEWSKLLSAPDGQSFKPAAFIPAEPLPGDDGLQLGQLIYSVPIDSAARRVLFTGLEGKIRYANLTDKKIGDLLVPPVRMPFWKLALTPDRSALVGTVVPTPGKSNKREPSHFQIWNYKALCESAGVSW